MLLTIEQLKKLKYVINDESGKASFVYVDNGNASEAELKYAIDMHETYSFAYGKPFLSNIDDLKKRVGIAKR